MKNYLIGLAALALLAAAWDMNVNAAHADDSGRWVCKTGPIWNGRSRGVNYTTGATQDQARREAVARCQHSGNADDCVSQIACWQE